MVIANITQIYYKHSKDIYIANIPQVTFLTDIQKLSNIYHRKDTQYKPMLFLILRLPES